MPCLKELLYLYQILNNVLEILYFLKHLETVDMEIMSLYAATPPTPPPV